MKNKIEVIVYFICLTTLSSMFFCANAIEIPTNDFMTEINYNNTSEIEELFKSNLTQASKIKYKKVPRGLIISIDGGVFFEEGQDEIKDTSKPILDIVGDLVKYLDKPCIIEGNANFGGIENPYYSTNWELSIVRAETIAQYLITIKEVNPQKIRAVGFGQMSPLPENLSYYQNDTSQRIDFVIINYENTDLNINPQ